MKRPGLFILIALSLVAGHLLLGLLALPLTGFYGDMTRIARLPEYHFGGLDPQPVPAPEALRSTSLEEADAVVVGDSFSQGLVWQTELARRGIKVFTMSWNQVGSKVCADFAERLKALGFRGKYLLIQSNESAFVNRLRDSAGCPVTRQTFATGRWQAQPPVTPPEGLVVDLKKQLSAGTVTLWNTGRYLLHGPELEIRPKDAALIRTRRIKDGCQLFSHRHCEILPLFEYAQLPLKPAQETYALMRAVNARHAELQVIWIVMPTKTSVYLDYPTDFWDQAPADLTIPNLARLYASSKHEIRDLYLPNDSHLSTRGYLLTGQHLAALLQSRKP